MSPNPLRHSFTPLPPYAGYLTLITPLRHHKRYVTVSNTTLTYGHRPDQVLWTADLTQCIVSTSAKTVCVTLPSGKKVRFRVSKPELQIWYPWLMAGVMGLRKYYCVGASMGRFARGTLFSGCDRGDGSDIRVWQVDKRVDVLKEELLRSRDRVALELCQRVDRAIRVIDVFEDSAAFHVVTEVFRGHDLGPSTVGDEACIRRVVRDMLNVLAELHDCGLVHGSLDEAVLIERGRAWVMVYGYAHPVREFDADVKAVGAIWRNVLGERVAEIGMEGVLSLLEKGVPARLVLKDPWFRDCLVVDFDALDHHSDDDAKAEVESPRTVLPS